MNNVGSVLLNYAYVRYLDLVHRKSADFPADWRRKRKEEEENIQGVPKVVVKPQNLHSGDHFLANKPKLSGTVSFSLRDSV